MPDAADSQALNKFLDEVRTVLAERYGPNVARKADRDQLARLANSFHEHVRPRLLGVYVELDETACLDAGISGQQLELKVALVTATVEPPPGEGALSRPDPRTGSEPSPEPPARLKKSAIRRFLKRAKILAGSLGKLIPGAEALMELLDFADSVLDR